MHKGLKALTTLIAVGMVSSALAYGPTLKLMPDVYVSNQGDNGFFRFSDALVLNDYVTPGVSSGPGSTSDTLYWAYAMKQLDWATQDASGGFKAVASHSHQLGAGTNAFQPSTTEGTPAWITEVNSNAGVDLASPVTFTNVRLNPAGAPATPPYSQDPAGVNLPAYILDAEQATLYVTDGSGATTPSTQTFRVVTYTDGPDTLSGGACYTNFQTLTGYSSWFDAGLGYNWSTAGVSYNTDPSVLGLMSVAKTATQLSITMPVSQDTGTGSFALKSLYMGVEPSASAPDVSGMLAGQLYRMKGTIASGNGSVAANAQLFLALNARTSIGYSYFTFAPGAAGGPVIGSPKTKATFLVPLANGGVDPNVIVVDSTVTAGGATIFSALVIDAIDPADLVGAATLLDQGTGAAAPFTVAASSTAGAFGIDAVFAHPGESAPTMTMTPNSAGTASQLTINSAATDNQCGWGGFGAQIVGPAGLFNPSADKLVLVKASVVASNSTPPDLWFFTSGLDGDASQQVGYLLSTRFANGSATNPSGLSTTPKDIYLAFESGVGGPMNFFFYALNQNESSILSGDAGNGAITMRRLTVTEYDMPCEP